MDDKIKYIPDKAKQILTIIFFIVAGLVGFCILYSYEDSFTQFGASILIVGISTGIFYLIDRYLLIGFDTIEELKKNNIAVGLGLIAYSIIIGFSLLAAFK